MQRPSLCGSSTFLSDCCLMFKFYRIHFTSYLSQETALWFFSSVLEWLLPGVYFPTLHTALPIFHCTLQTIVPLFSPLCRVVGKRFNNTRNVTISNNKDLGCLALDSDACESWSTCRVEAALQDLANLAGLPSCPCVYPAELPYQPRIYDAAHGASFK